MFLTYRIKPQGTLADTASSGLGGRRLRCRDTDHGAEAPPRFRSSQLPAYGEGCPLFRDPLKKKLKAGGCFRASPKPPTKKAYHQKKEWPSLFVL